MADWMHFTMREKSSSITDSFVTAPQIPKRTRKQGLSISCNVSDQLGKLNLNKNGETGSNHSSQNVNKSVASLCPKNLAASTSNSVYSINELQENIPISKVNERLFLGNEDICNKTDAIENLSLLGITHVINMAVEIKSPVTPSACPVTFADYPIRDTPDEDIQGILRQVADYIGILESKFIANT